MRVSNVLISSNDWLMCFPNKNSILLFLEITNKLDKKNSHDLDQEIIKGMFYVRNRMQNDFGYTSKKQS